MSTPQLKDKQVVLVVGGSQGIGLALVKNLLNGTDSKFTNPDSRVIATIRSPNAELEALQTEFPGRLYTETLDLAVDGEIDSFAKLIADKYGRLDVYIHNSGIAPEKHRSVAEPRISADDYIKTHLINSVAPQNLFCALLPVLQSTHELLGGSIKDSRPVFNEETKSDDATKVRVLFISSSMGSLNAYYHGIGVPCYSSSKSTLNLLALDLAHNFPYIAINVCNPGYVKTALSPHGILTTTESATGVLSTWNSWGFASISMKSMFSYDGAAIPY